MIGASQNRAATGRNLPASHTTGGSNAGHCRSAGPIFRLIEVLGAGYKTDPPPGGDRCLQNLPGRSLVNGVTHVPPQDAPPWLDYLVYLAVRLVVALAQVLTIEQSYALARLLAWVMYKVDTRHRRSGLENLRLAFGDRYDEADRDRIVRGVYLHFCTMVMEILHIPRKIHLTNWRKYVRLVGHEPVLDRL